MTTLEKCGTTHYQGCACYEAERNAEIEGLKAKLAIAVDALESIAATHKPGMSEKQYWLDAGLDASAEDVAQDTETAREALAKLKETL